ncbi:ImmA/IrrE family metallo-endopeptidase [Aerococcaceae bacterium DSM 111021]|nr:ImmA/IrrE family metallo-endopeptidase [Aerococcaceae bacterium DSM 111021]
MNLVQRTIHRLVKECRTSNPYRIAEHLNIAIRYADTSDAFNGVYIPVDGKKLIILNVELRHDPKGAFVLAHELYHAINHAEMAYFYHKGHNAKGKHEREANEFATYLLLVGKSIYEGQTVFEILRRNYIPYEMEEFL